MTDDGDLALVGINVADSCLVKSENESDVGWSWSSTQASTSRLPLLEPTVVVPNVNESAAPSSTSISSQRRPNNPEQVQEVMEWLIEIIPTLLDSGDDCRFYAEELVAIGFHPNCVTQCELQMDDLAFMKPLHQRYIYNEVTGRSHPWKP